MFEKIKFSQYTKKEVRMRGLKKTALVLSAIGAINWGLAELGFNLVEKLITSWAGATTGMIVYYVIALCGLFALYKVFK